MCTSHCGAEHISNYSIALELSVNILHSLATRVLRGAD